jgi:hypothetical protein
LKLPYSLVRWSLQTKCLSTAIAAVITPVAPGIGDATGRAFAGVKIR